MRQHFCFSDDNTKHLTDLFVSSLVAMVAKELHMHPPVYTRHLDDYMARRLPIPGVQTVSLLL
jgi:hypothetical protein